MQEIEVKVINQSHKDWHDKLIDIGAEKIFDDHMREAKFKPRNESFELLRLREEGDQVFLNLKTTDDGHPLAKSHDETEVLVGEYDATVRLLERMGFSARRKRLFTEKHRVSYKLENARIEFDKQLGEDADVPEYMEIEVHSKDHLEETLKLLEIKESDALPWTGGDVRRFHRKGVIPKK